MKEWFEIFKIGTHTSSEGITKSYTQDDLQKIADNYNSNEHEAPIVIGHPKDNDPAYGWIDKLKIVGDRLLAMPKQVVKEFADAVKEGKFKKRSVSLYEDGTLRHVGFLGAVPPAIKGLADIKFEESANAVTIEFSETDPEKEKLLNEIAELQTKISSFNETSQKLQEYETNLEKLKTDLLFAETNRVQAEENLTKINLKLRSLEFQQYLNEKLAYGNLTPAQGEKVAALLEVLDSIELKEHNGQQVYEFSDGKKANPVTLLKDFCELLPKQIPADDNTANKQTQEGNKTENFSEELAVANRLVESLKK